MAETAIAAVLSKFGELAANEAKVLIQVGDDMMLLRDRLEWLQAFIRDADRKRRAGTDGLTRVWVRQTRDVAFEAEDALDEFFNKKVDLRSQGYPRWKIWRAHLMGFGNQILVRHRLSNRIKSIKSRLNQISDNQREYMIEHTPLAALTSSSTAIGAWRDDNKKAVGFDADVRNLEELLLGEAERPLMFISIVGESGVGKRTLGKVISSKLIGKFHPLIRLTVPQGCTTNFLFKEVLVRIEGEENADCGQPYESNSNVTDKIRHLLGNKKYLLVLSGICSKAMLNCVKESLPDNKNGSRVMLTFDGENEELAWHADTMNREGISGIHQLSRLNKERSGKLFRSRAFKTEKSDEEGHKSKYDQIVYDITGGYPLAIVVLGGLLRFKERPGQLEAVLQQLRPAPGMEAVLQLHRPGPGMEAEGGKDCMECHISPPPTQVDLSSTGTAMERVFWASFEDLPNDLKSCFLYFGAFSKNMGFYADEVVRMWIGEGFIKPQKGKTIEELGHGYLKELALRCLVDVVEMDDGDIKIIRVHSRLYVFLQCEVREAGFVDVHDTGDVFVSLSVRRLSFRSFDSKKHVKFTKKLPKLRSFICRMEESETEESNDPPFHDLKFLHGSKFLRLIYVNGLRLRELPHGIGEMIHLRYLYVRCKGLKELPPSIKWLLNLQTLDIRTTKVDKIDPGFWKIKTLRHVLAEQLTLPETLDEELEELQTLHGVKPPGEGEGEWSKVNCPLHKMTKLRSLDLRGIEEARHGAALESALRDMCLLVNLSLKGDVIPQCVFTVEGLQYLETVQLDGSMQWPHVSSNVRKDRPNLAQLTILKKSNDEELEKMGFTSLGTVPGVYRRSKKQEESAAANQNGEHKDEASSSAKEQPEYQGEEAEAKPEDQGLQGQMMQTIPPSEPLVPDHAAPLLVPGCDAAADGQASTPDDASGCPDKPAQEAEMDT